MKARIILAALLIATSGTFAFAENGDANSLSGKAMHDLPGNNGNGSTATPVAKPAEQSLSGKAMRDQPGNNSDGTTGNPVGKPVESSLSGKAMRELPGNN